MALSLRLDLPAWAEDVFTKKATLEFNRPEEKMHLAILLAGENVSRRTGGPFGAAIYNEDSHKLVAVGVNAVITQHTSIAHAETIAIALAQQNLKSHDLAGKKGNRFSLYTSGQPCIMCFGVIWWSGITRLVCAARAEDIEKIVGFREGPLPHNWPSQLANREGLPNIEVTRDLMREQACDVLKAYASSGQPVYNAGSSGNQT